jgi:hypothetical protein
LLQSRHQGSDAADQAHLPAVGLRSGDYREAPQNR